MLPYCNESYPRPMASICEMIKEGRKSCRKSGERTPPFFMTLLLRMLSAVERLGCLSRNSLRRKHIKLSWPVESHDDRKRSPCLDDQIVIY